MNLTKSQRKELNQLSLQLFGVASKWKSLLSRPEFRVILGKKETYGQQKYVSLHNSNKSRTGTVMKLETAIARGFFESKDKKQHEKAQELLKKIQEQPIVVVDSREPTFEELKQSLIDNIDIQKLSRMKAPELAMIMAYRLVNDQLKDKILLDVKETDKEDFDKILASMSDEMQMKIKAFLPDPPKESSKSISIDGLLFIKEAALCLTNPEEASAVYITLLANVDITPKGNTNLIKGLTVQQFMNKINRKRNEMLRDKQKRPEYYAAKEAKAKAKQEELKKAQEETARLRAELNTKSIPSNVT
ncbi:MAG: hypothetical protein QXL01_00065 [Thermoplasmatales archaeon]